ncbi:UTRA domain-containing protein [Moraxella canis]|uniref:UTRA domain-containing protein n=1 Tax=Moraxella canis TaxID=90239 RepID=A0ABZ0WVG7_9GAMM|nr:UTRA domain-containing protein [Moraxella canis]WQE03241.1 UTRA domain-containing protein [Moraxella canis]
MSNKTPAYLRIKNAILDNIHAGTWASGTAIPAEITLAEDFGVSRMTVNRAVKELEAERVLERRQGSGTYVAQQKYNNAHIEIRNIAKDINERFNRYRAQVIAQKTLDFEALNQPENHWLNALFFHSQPAHTDKLYQVCIVHYGDDLPIQYEDRWVNAAIIPEFINQDFSSINTSDYLIDHVPLEYGDYQIQAKLAPINVCEALQMQAHEPALLHARHTKSQGQPVTFVNMWHPGSRFSFGGRL